MKKLFLLLQLIPLICWGQKNKKFYIVDPPTGTNVIYVYTEQRDADAYQKVLKFVQGQMLPLAVQDTVTHLLETNLFSLAQGYDMLMRISVKDGTVRLRGYCYNILGIEFEAECGAMMRGPTLAFNRLNAFGMLLSSRFGSGHLEYKKE